MWCSSLPHSLCSLSFVHPCMSTVLSLIEWTRAGRCEGGPSVAVPTACRSESDHCSRFAVPRAEPAVENVVSLYTVEVLGSGDPCAEEVEEAGDVHPERGGTSDKGGSMERLVGGLDASALWRLPGSLKTHQHAMDDRSTVATTRMKAIAPVLIPSAASSSRGGSKS